ncbi:MAG: MCP four helix bundle domain-containing protein [Paucibacter sp.]|nr:MCP four helix bundle domain-containing protein [Roseateles sp.]
MDATKRSHDWSVGAKLMSGFALVVAMGLVVALLGIHGLRVINEYNDRLYYNELLGISYIKEANIDLIYAGRARARFAAASSEADRAAARDEFDKAVATMRSWLAKAKPLTLSAEGRALFATTEGRLDPWLASVHAYFQVVAGQPLGADNSEVKRIDVATRQLTNQLDDELTDLTKIKERNGKNAAEEGTQVYENLSKIMIALTVASGVLGMAVGYLLPRSITRQLGGEPRMVAGIAVAIAEGDLTGEIDTSRAGAGSVVAAMSEMQGALRKVVTMVRTGSDNVATASSQIAQGNADLSQRTEEQASALEETSATMQELNATVRSNADNAGVANRLAAEASQVAGNGGRLVRDVVETMRGIQGSSQKIAEIIGVIDSIAFQTNILALNAAVEAARAGEEGRGFAVVAGEVRALAQRSAAAAKDIKSLITASVAQVEQGTSLVDKAGGTMDEIVSAIQRVSDLVAEISSASAEQSSGVSQVEQSVVQMDHVTQQNAALVEQSAAAAESLKMQAQELVRAIAMFRVSHGELLAGAA